MRGVALLSIALVATLVFSGCASKSDSSSSTLAGSSSSGTQNSSSAGTSASTATGAATSSSGATAAGSTANAAPVINSFKANVTAFKAKFTFNATDADKDNLTFILSFGDKTVNATGKLPLANVTHVYAAVGNYTSRLVVSDGVLIANRTLLVKVAAPAAASSGAVIQTFTVSWTVGVAGCGLVETADHGTGDGVISAARNLDPAAPGHPFKAVFSAFTPDNLEDDLFFFQGATRLPVLAVTKDPAVIEGVVPDGATLASFRNCGARGTSVTMTIG